ncbi:coiled-coil and C2 domain-containing protein 1-like isoform X2 [Varroa jacobsoni]|uniref:coiled-coil and C2 domain-containing protein 1-like isoform X2 n=1 Tax=Varroa jacobsoni TaxID=62625 RepID=UPI000BFA6EBC|nr:coiled-coil and C2 domain-containing protein 1-like isoform X2 [Varroa jacobsoni]
MFRKSRNAGRKLGSDMAGLGRMNLAGLGLMDINDLNFDSKDDDDIDERDLEAELNALMSGKRHKKREESTQKRAPMDLDSIKAMANAAIMDDISNDDVDLEGIENDEELLAELNELNDSQDEDDVAQETPQSISPMSTPALRPQNVPIETASILSSKSTPSPMDITDVLSNRLKNYRVAEEASKKIGDSSKVRRFSRAIKTLEGQLRQAQLGKVIPEADIPPPVAVPKASPECCKEERVGKPEDQLPEGGAGSYNKTQEAVPLPNLQTSGTYPPPYIATVLDDLDDTDDIERTEQVSSNDPQASKSFREAPMSPPSRSASGPPQLKLPQLAAPTPSVSVPVASDGSSLTQEDLLTTRRNQYRQAALMAKQKGDKELAIKYLRTVKQFDVVLQALLEGKPIELSKMPPPPPGMICPATPISSIPLQSTAQEEIPDFIDMNSKTDPAMYNAPPQAQTVLGALEQRLAKYQEAEAQAKDKGDSSRARRLGRIVKDYETTIKAHKAGKKVNFEDLPVPPGFGPIPSETATGQKVSASVNKSQSSLTSPYSSAQTYTLPMPSASMSAAPSPPKQCVKRQMSTTIEKQKQFLLERQRLFKEAAKGALKNGASKEQAMEYVRMMKGIEPMLQATELGLPVDLSSIPVPPQLQQDFVVVDKEDCDFQLSGDSEELYRTLEVDLEEQYETCMTNQEHFFKLGDVGSGTKFEKLAQDTRRDISVLKASWKRGEPVPSFRYEDRVFTIVRHNHDVPENVMQVSVIRGITLPGKPNELDTYVKIDFAYPADAPQSQRCSTVKDTTNPDYNFTGSFEVARKSRTFIRALKRVQLKIEIWSKRGFLRADGLLGAASIRLADLETKCDLHEVFPVMDGRRDTGGKLEVKIRVSEPFTAKQVEEIKRRWLIIGK